MSGLALWQLSGTRAGQQRLGLRAAAVSLWLAVPAIILATPNTLMPLAIGNQGAEFIASGPVPKPGGSGIVPHWERGRVWGFIGANSIQPDGRCSPVPLGLISAAIVLSVAIGFAAMDREWLYEAGSQNNPTDAVLAELTPQEASQPESHANRTWEQIVADRRQMGLNFLKGAALVAACLAGIYYCLNIGWSALKTQKARRSRRSGRSRIVIAVRA